MTVNMISNVLLTRIAGLALLASLVAPSGATKTTNPFYIIAHMANNAYSLDWSVQQGANAIEADIQFDGDTNPYLFEHGGICDCSCLLIPNSGHICTGALRSQCSGGDASNEAKNHLQHVARLPGIALLLMDSKVNARLGSRLRPAGDKIVALLEQNLFSYGYKGKVVISAGDINCFDYVSAAAQAAARTPNKDRYYFSFDQMGDNYQVVAGMLSRFTKNRLFGTGISSCVSKSFESGIRQAVNGVRVGEIGMSYIWTLDKQSSMEAYIELGVQGIITNRVALLKQVAASKGLRIATPSDPIPAALRDVVSADTCDCDYHSGGCTISYPAPSGRACLCKYKGAWTCGGSVTDCSNRDDEKCVNPDGSIEACYQGRGDCEGY